MIKDQNFVIKLDDYYQNTTSYVSALWIGMAYLVEFPEGQVEVHVDDQLEHGPLVMSKAAFEFSYGWTDEELIEAVHQAEREFNG